MAAWRLLWFLWDTSSQTWTGRRDASFLFIWQVMRLFFSLWSISKLACSGFHWSNVPWPSRQPLPLDTASGVDQTPSKHAQKPWKWRRLCGGGNICLDPRWPQARIRMSHIVDFKRWCPSPFWQVHCVSSDNMVWASPRFLSGSADLLLGLKRDYECL